ncbi:MAG TPA: 6-bladed beta-propeller, partial [Nitrososphaeraceae archaeon]|nr:6-bladed beta-propeller [Nitrososphaeraceae archaeon]
MIICFIPIVFVSVIYAQEFEFNSEDYYDAEENSPNTNSEDQSINTDSEDTDKEPCIDGQLESSAAVLSAVSDDSYTSNFHFVKKFDQNGNLVDSLGTVGPKDGQFLHAHGITIDSQDNVYVSDAEKCNIQKFDKDGNFITKWGTKGIGPGEFLQPESMAVDSSDNIYLAEYSRKNIQKFDGNGKFITMWGEEGSKESEFKKPWGIAVDSQDNVYVSDQVL